MGSEPDYRAYKAFIVGENINLCIPSREAIEKDGWADWFNNLDGLSNSGHGIFPNFPEDQERILEGIIRKEKLALLICEKNSNEAAGVVSLQKIDFSKRQAEIAIMMGAPEKVHMPSLASLEAMALISQHGFEVMGMNRIFAGQAYPNLVGWNKLLELLGYKCEGFARNAFIRGHDVADMALIACSYYDFSRLTDRRAGNLWPGSTNIKQLIKMQPKESYAQKLDATMKALEDEYFSFLFS